MRITFNLPKEFSEEEASALLALMHPTFMVRGVHRVPNPQNWAHSHYVDVPIGRHVTTKENFQEGAKDLTVHALSTLGIKDVRTYTVNGNNVHVRFASLGHELTKRLKAEAEYVNSI